MAAPPRTVDGAAGRRLAYLSLETPRPGQASDTHVREIVAGLRRLGWSVELFATRAGGASSGAGLFTRMLGYVRAQTALARRLGAFDVVYVRAHFAAAPIAALAKARGLKVVHEINGAPGEIAVTYPFLRPFAAAISALYRVQFAAADRLFPVVEGLGVWARGFAGHDRITVVPNGADAALFRPDGPAHAPGYPYVVFVGGLAAWHGVGVMLDALADPAWPADLRLVVAGDGPERGRIEACADPRLVRLGRAAQERTPALLRGAVAALCPIENPAGRSGYGVAPLKLYEAMGCGAAVIASDLPHQAELVRGLGAGLVTPPGDAPALAQAVARLAADPQAARVMGRAGAAYVAREASWARRAEALDAALRAPA
jgi:glycosyltransferase involved in cell wall biosynthesis